jgi:hypothetical protein
MEFFLLVVTCVFQSTPSRLLIQAVERDKAKLSAAISIEVSVFTGPIAAG